MTELKKKRERGGFSFEKQLKPGRSALKNPENPQQYHKKSEKLRMGGFSMASVLQTELKPPPKPKKGVFYCV